MLPARAHVILNLIWILHPADTQKNMIICLSWGCIKKSVKGLSYLKTLRIMQKIAWRQQLLEGRHPTPKGAMGVSALPLLF